MEPWGPQISNTDFTRRNSLKEISFNLSVDHLDLRIGGSDTNRLPIMGPSGAGKSTLLNLLSCISFPQSDESNVAWKFPDGYECSWGKSGPGKDVLLKLRQKYFGFAFQTPSIQPQLTIHENLTFGLENQGVAPSVAADEAYKSLVSVFSGNEARARNMLTRYDSEVSGGERQRISLLQAFIRNPNVLFADEPTGSLDKGTRGEVMGLLRDWLAEKPKERLLFWVTHHDSDPADNNATKRLVVADGGAAWEELKGKSWKQSEFVPEVTK